MNYFIGDNWGTAPPALFDLSADPQGEFFPSPHPKKSFGTEK